MLRALLLPLILLVTLLSQAQENQIDPIDAQRPTLTESYSIIRPNMMQFENGLDYISNADSVVFGTFMRGSITNRVELRGFTDYSNLSSFGGKFIAVEADSSAWGIGAAFVYNRDLQLKSDDFRMALTKSYEAVFFTFNFGYREFIYNIILVGLPIGQSLNYFIEYYNDPMINRIHSGVTWIPFPDIQFDINGGWIDSSDWYAGIGFSFRLR